MCRPPLTVPSLQILLKSMKINENTIRVLASIGNAQASPHPPKPSNPLAINENQRKSIKIHVLLPIGNFQASSHPPYFSKPVGTVPNAMSDGNHYAKKEVGGRGGAYIYIYINIYIYIYMYYTNVCMVCIYKTLHED